MTAHRFDISADLHSFLAEVLLSVFFAVQFNQLPEPRLILAADGFASFVGVRQTTASPAIFLHLLLF